jgi:branched-subunit amino acid aminotransferase/4-amino-4-deoxychorismate lyase
VNELLLVASDGRVLEGSSSSFFAVKSGIVYTSMEDVLVGTVQRVVLTLCRTHGIPVELHAPRHADLAMWDEAFLASASGLNVPFRVSAHWL